MLQQTRANPPPPLPLSLSLSIPISLSLSLSLSLSGEESDPAGRRDRRAGRGVQRLDQKVGAKSTWAHQTLSRPKADAYSTAPPHIHCGKDTQHSN